jgi:hypothetical protein
MVAGRHALHSGPHLLHHARSLVPEHDGEDPFGVGSGERVGVGVTDPGGGEPHQTLAFPGPFELDLFDLQRLAGLEGHGGANLHHPLPWRVTIGGKEYTLAP